MEERGISWLRRVNFSHTICHRLDSSLHPQIPLSLESNRDFDFKPNPDVGPNHKGFPARHQKVNPEASIGAQLDRGASRVRKEQSFKAKQRSLSPLPTVVLSDTFMEAKAEEKRFLTPPPSRKGSDRKVFDKLLSKETPPPPQKSHHFQHFFSMKAADKAKSRKDASWARYFDHGVGRVIAVETTEEWSVDLSKLYLGPRFAAGAHSKLYHGIYKGQPVAVKIIRQPDDDENGVMAARLEKQFSREVSILSHLYHRNVIKLAAACRNPPVFCIITEYLAGGSLRGFLNRLEHKSLHLDKLVSKALDIARGMEYIHSQGVIHCDLKPGNILFDEDFCVKIADFGTACEEAYCDAIAEDLGTFRWMAPEMIKHKPYGRKVDVYSFGLVLWEMASGRMPYEDMSPIQAAFAVVDKNLRPIIPVDCPPALGALIEQCWALNPEKRPEFWQIVKVLERFESAIEKDGSLDLVQNPTCQDHKNRLFHWIQKLKPSHALNSAATTGPTLQAMRRRSNWPLWGANMVRRAVKDDGVDFDRRKDFVGTEEEGTEGDGGGDQAAKMKRKGLRVIRNFL